MWWIIFFIILLLLILIGAGYAYSSSCKQECAPRNTIPVVVDTWGPCGCSWGIGIIFLIFLILIIAVFCWKYNAGTVALPGALDC